MVEVGLLSEGRLNWVSMSNLDIRSKTPQEIEIIDLLQKLRINPAATESFAKLIKLSNQYVLIDPVVVESEDARFKAHQICSKCQIDRSNSDADARGEKALRYKLQVCMLRTLGFVPNKSINRWLQGLFNTIIGCIDCYKGFLRAKDEIGPE